MDKVFNFFKRDKRRIDTELINVSFALRLTKEEFEFVGNQSKEECSSCNSIIRKCIKHYRNSLNIIPK